MLICGGMDASGELADCWLLQMQSMRWEQLEMSLPRAPKELGRCQVLWSEGAALVCSHHGSWSFRPGKEDQVADPALKSDPWSKPKALPPRSPRPNGERTELPPVRAGPWKACPQDAEAFHQSWPQQTPRKAEKAGATRPGVSSAVGRERRRSKEPRELAPVKPPKDPRARPPMKC